MRDKLILSLLLLLALYAAYRLRRVVISWRALHASAQAREKLEWAVLMDRLDARRGE